MTTMDPPWDTVTAVAVGGRYNSLLGLQRIGIDGNNKSGNTFDAHHPTAHGR